MHGVDRQQQLARIVRVTRFDEPVRLSSGAMSREFVDAKEALAEGDNLAIACQAMIDTAAEAGIEFDAAGGLTMGADQFAHGIAIIGHKRWFVVRKEPKGRGTNKLVEGAALGPDVRVLLVEDVVSTGASFAKAYDQVVALGAEVVLATALADRGDTAAAYFESVGVPYKPLLTYRDLGIDPVVPPSEG